MAIPSSWSLILWISVFSITSPSADFGRLRKSSDFFRNLWKWSCRLQKSQHSQDKNSRLYLRKSWQVYNSGIVFRQNSFAPSWLSVRLCTLCSLNHYSAWRFNEMIRVIVINAERSLLLQQNPNFSNHLGKSKWVQIIKRFENSVWLVKGSYVWFKLSGNLKTRELEKSGSCCILLGLPRTLPSLPFTLSSNPRSPALRSLSNDDGDSYENFT